MARTEEEMALLQQVFDEEYEKLASVERERAMLKAEPRGEGLHLRPSDQFIDDNLGPPKSHAEMCDIANAKAETRLAQHHAKEERMAEKAESFERHNKAIEERKAELNAPEQEDGRPKIYRDGGPEYEAALARFDEQEAVLNQPPSEQEKDRLREAFNRESQERGTPDRSEDRER